LESIGANSVPSSAEDAYASAYRFAHADFRQDQEKPCRPTVANVGAILDAYIADRRAEVADPDRPAYAAARLRPTFGHLLPEHIDKTVCRNYVKGRRLAGIKIGSAHTELAALRAALNWAAKQQPPWIDHAPHVWMPPKPEPKDRHLDRDEAIKLITACTAPHVTIPPADPQLSLASNGTGLIWSAAKSSCAIQTET
jgi:hypothetical protein